MTNLGFLRRTRPAVGLAVAVSVAAILVAGCGSGGGGPKASASSTSSTSAAPTTTTTSLPPGFVPFNDVADSFKLAVPSAWTQIDPETAAGRQQIQQLSPTINGNSSFQYMRFFGVGGNSGQPIRSDVAVLVVPAPGLTDADLPTIVQGFVDSVHSHHATVESTSTNATVSGHPAAEVKAMLPVVTKSGSHVTIPVQADFVVVNSRAYSIVMDGSDPALASVLSTFMVLS